MKREQVAIFEKLFPQINSLYNEINVLSKKTPNDALNKFKLKFVNQILEIANSLLGDTNKPFEDFTLFDEEQVPTNSDVNIILSQYITCLEKLRSDNMDKSGFQWTWIVNND